MKILVCFFVAFLNAIANAQGIEITRLDGAFEKPAAIKPGTFGDEEFSIILSNAKNGALTVTGHRLQSGGMRLISGNMTKSGVLRASMKSGSRSIPINGQYNPKDDAVSITSIDGKPTSIALPRFGKKLIKTGPYHGRSTEPDMAWELTISRSSGPDFNVVGFVENRSKRNRVKGTLKSNGKLLAQGVDNELVKVDGNYDSDAHCLNVYLHLTGVGERIGATLQPGRLPAPGAFGLISKVVGNVPGPAELNDFKIAGSVSENSFFLEILMKPPYEGQAQIKFEFSDQLGSSLKVGQIIELTVMSTAEKSGKDAPNLAGSGFWHVEGDGAEVLETKKTFVGTASDGKFYPSVQGVTRFKVLGRGTIKVAAVYVGQFWGPGGNYNWNPCTYTYKFGEKPKVDR